MIRYLTGGHGSVEIAVAPDVKEAHDRAVLFLNNVIEKNERKEIRSEN